MPPDIKTVGIIRSSENYYFKQRKRVRRSSSTVPKKGLLTSP